jgi:hypothetical protein
MCQESKQWHNHILKITWCSGMLTRHKWLYWANNSCTAHHCFTYAKTTKLYVICKTIFKQNWLDLIGICSRILAPGTVISLTPQCLSHHVNQAARILTILPISYWWLNYVLIYICTCLATVSDEQGKVILARNETKSDNIILFIWNVIGMTVVQCNCTLLAYNIHYLATCFMLMQGQSSTIRCQKPAITNLKIICKLVGNNSQKKYGYYNELIFIIILIWLN